MIRVYKIPQGDDDGRVCSFGVLVSVVRGGNFFCMCAGGIGVDCGEEFGGVVDEGLP